MKVTKFGFVVLALLGVALLGLTLRPIRAQSDDAPSLFFNGYAVPKPRAVVRVLNKVPTRATLNQIKAILPRDTKYLWVSMNSRGDWKWNTLQFKGKFTGILVFANDRAKYRFTEREKTQVAQWRAGDAVHSVDVFLGNVPRDETPQQMVIVTRDYVNEIARLLGWRGTRYFNDPVGGPPANAWSATWKLSQSRELNFSQDLSYSESQERPTLQLSFKYSHLYQA